MSQTACVEISCQKTQLWFHGQVYNKWSLFSLYPIYSKMYRQTQLKKNALKKDDFILLVQNWGCRVIWYCWPQLLCCCALEFTELHETNSHEKWIFLKTKLKNISRFNILLQKELALCPESGPMVSIKKTVYIWLGINFDTQRI